MGSSPYPQMGSSCACSTLPSREVRAHPQPALASPKKGSSPPHQLPRSLAGPRSRKSGCFSLQFGENDRFQRAHPCSSPANAVEKKRIWGDLRACDGRGWVKRAPPGRSVFKKQLLAGKRPNPAFLSEGIRVMSPPARGQERSCRRGSLRAAPARATNICVGLPVGSVPLQGRTAGWALLLYGSFLPPHISTGHRLIGFHTCQTRLY